MDRIKKNQRNQQGQKEQEEPGDIRLWKNNSACRRGMHYRIPGIGRARRNYKL